MASPKLLTLGIVKVNISSALAKPQFSDLASPKLLSLGIVKVNISSALAKPQFSPFSFYNALVFWNFLQECEALLLVVHLATVVLHAVAYY